MMAKEKTEKEINGRLRDLKIELLKNPQKRKGIKREIARLLTSMNAQSKTETKLEDKSE